MSLQETLAATPRSRPRVTLECMVDEHGAGRRLVMVLSAMGRTTDQLNPPACAVEARPQLRQLDALLSVGKHISSALAALAVHDLGVPRVPLIGPQAGVLADDRHGNAQAADASQSAAATPSGGRVMEALAQHSASDGAIVCHVAETPSSGSTPGSRRTGCPT